MKRFSFDAYRIHKPIFIVFILIIGISNYGFTQSESKIDSLESLLHSSKGIKKIELLDKLSKEYVKSNSDKSLEAALKMLSLSADENNNAQIQKAYINCASAYIELNDFDSTTLFAQKAIKLNKQTDNYQLLAKAYSLISDVNNYRGEHDEGIENCQKAMEIYMENGDSIKMAKLYKDIYVLYRAKGDYNLAMEYTIKSLNFFEKINDSMFIADAYRVMASLYIGKDNQLKQKSNLYKAKRYLIKKEHTELYRLVMTDIAGLYSGQRKQDSALMIYYEIESILEKLNDKRRIASLYINIGNALMRSDSVDKALSAFRYSKSIFNLLKMEKHVCHVDYSLGDVYYAIYNYDSAEYYLLKSLSVSKKINYWIIYQASLSRLSLVYEETNNYKNAFNYYKAYKQYIDSTTGEKVQLKIAELETKYETSKKEQQILELEHQQEIEKSEKQSQEIVFGGILIVFILVLIGILHKRKKDKQIQRQKEIVHKKEKELATAELEKSKLKEEELQQSILYKSKQLSTHALHMMQKNTMLHEMQSDIKTLSKKASIDDKSDFKRINMQINQSLRSHKDWDVFKLYFEDVNKNFYEKLNEINPELTTNDHRLCALIKLNMNSKEMASVLNVAPNSIKSSRYRLKKKLGLDVEADLEEFIRGLGVGVDYKSE
ncbi:MAG: tetratricopeptide repeat protein [Bacteroidota bacterium]